MQTHTMTATLDNGEQYLEIPAHFTIHDHGAVLDYASMGTATLPRELLLAMFGAEAIDAAERSATADYDDQPEHYDWRLECAIADTLRMAAE